MKNFVGYFLHSSQGREYLIQVPGVATAQLPDNEIAELLNWLVLTYSESQLPVALEPYTEDEVAGARKTPIDEPETVRTQVLDQIARSAPELAGDLKPEAQARYTQ